MFLYNLFFMVVMAGVLALSLGFGQPLTWLNEVLNTTRERIITGGVAGLGLLIGLYVLIASLKSDEPPVTTVLEGPLGEISMTVPAVKQIIMKAARTVEGIREVKPVVKFSRDGIRVFLHLMINPDYRVPEMTENLQNQVSRQLEDIGGLKVAEIKVLVDDIVNKSPRVK
ncbi:conserved hypothetical protein [Syntrophothermus lipocalidus DSM 12680]|uniref:Alkaline shock response membrane anchor protein AmaP n=2 Tax=Syntrophomonadaceae TaxID=68298 RepID=D7CKH4_SYNLT|nr:conserved hypothetical protein [Syntrophothermus lipocalidus DSM 12680]